ncbi:hypothetical protein Hdeb2414_s0024g00650871 [Helianthus debilis subsp. tardiflorus]
MWLGLGSFNRRNKGRRMSSRGATSVLFKLYGFVWVFCQFDWDMDELEEFTNERIFADELSEDQRDGFKEFAREKV